MELTKPRVDYMQDSYFTSDFEHCHRHYEVVLFTKADFHVFAEDVRYQIGSRYLLLIDRYVLHKYLYTPTEYARYMLQTPDVMPELRDKIFYSPCIVYALRDEDFDRIRTLFSITHENFTADRDSHGARLSIELLLWEISRLEYPLMLGTKEGKNDTLAREVIRYLNEAYMEPITLSGLSKRFFTDQYYLCRKFKAYCGYTIIQYLQYRRIKQAQNLLLSGMRAEELLPMCGFENIQHFYRVFRKLTGCTPEEYKRREQ